MKPPAAYVHVQPAAGRVVKLPPDGKRTLPPEGANVPLTMLVRRWLADGDVVLAAPAAAEHEGEHA